MTSLTLTDGLITALAGIAKGRTPSNNQMRQLAKLGLVEIREIKVVEGHAQRKILRAWVTTAGHRALSASRQLF